MDNGCKTYQQATLEMVWLGTQCRSIDVIYAVVDQKNFLGGPPPPPPPPTLSQNLDDRPLLI